jgi:hypothetical protein
MSENLIKIVLVILLTLCLFNMPYGYYQIVRFCGFIGFGLLAFKNSKDEKSQLILIYGALSLLFQPFFKVNLGREIWNLVDIVVSIFLALTIIQELKISKSS